MFKMSIGTRTIGDVDLIFYNTYFLGLISNDKPALENDQNLLTHITYFVVLK